MGVVNVTPDSFSDGGAFDTAEDAVAHGRRLASEGAQILDVGGESTRPGADPVPAEEELRRVLPVVEGLAGAARVSIDTMKLAVAEAAVDAGASYVNDVTAFRHDPDLAGFVADRGLDCCLMHMLGEPRTMQRDPRYGDVVSDVKAFLTERMEAAVRAGVPEERIQLDPGIGFGKTLEHNLELLRRLDELTELGRPLVIGTSRKTFIGRITGRDVTERVHGTVATCVLALERGARVFRVHDVAAVGGRAEGHQCYGRGMADEPEDYDDELEDDDDEEGLEVGVTIEIIGTLAVHAPRRHGRGAQDRSAAVARRPFRRRRARRADHRSRRGHDRLRRGLPGDRADRPGAVLQDARAAVRGDRRPAGVAVRRRERDGQGLQARAADPAAGRRGLRRSLARRTLVRDTDLVLTNM